MNKEMFSCGIIIDPQTETFDTVNPHKIGSEWDERIAENRQKCYQITDF